MSTSLLLALFSISMDILIITDTTVSPEGILNTRMFIPFLSNFLYSSNNN